MNFAVIENGIVTNIVVAERDYALSQGWIYIGSSPVNIGSLYKEESNTIVIKYNDEEIEVPLPSIPESIELPSELEKLRTELEFTQAVVDELLFGGVI